ADFGRPGDYYARQIHRWSQQYRASETEKIEAMERLMEWLPKNIPASTETTLVHGDYRPGNMIVHPTEPPVAAVPDWELSTRGRWRRPAGASWSRARADGTHVACLRMARRRSMKNLLLALVTCVVIGAPLVAAAQVPAHPPRPIWRELGLSEARTVLGMRIKN